MASTLNLQPVQLEYVSWLRAGKTIEMTEAARAADKASHAELNRLRKQSENSQCFDCTAIKPGWAVLPHGVFICIDCAQVHRSLGRQVSQTKAINTGTYLWYPQELDVMRKLGNAVVGRAYACAPEKPSQNAPPTEKLQYATTKYTTNKWGPSWKAVVEPDTHVVSALDDVADTPSLPKAQVTQPSRHVKPIPSQRSGRLCGARRQATMSQTIKQVSNCCDLIDLSGEPPTKNQAETRWPTPTKFSPCEPWAHSQLVGPSEKPPVSESVAGSSGGIFEAKKADILSHFKKGAFQPFALSSSPSTRFFAQFGL